MTDDFGRHGQPAHQRDWLAETDDDLTFEAFAGSTFDVDLALHDARFLDWLAREARERSREADRCPERDHLARGAELVARMHEQTLHIRRTFKPAALIASSAALIDACLPDGRRVPFVDLGVAAGIGRDLWDEMPEQWVELPASLPDANYVALRIVGDSMTPLIHSGDTVLIKREPAITPNAVVVARHPDDGYVCKKVERLTATSVVLASLAADGPAVVIPRDPRLIVGTVVLVWCRHRSKK
jgi:SOS-response transcriptional repressor LexA